ncbi:SnoaL-like domain-containing protein [Niastella yeongjuensis]|nr:SnoaL-like domain-containing protein [Niastella yeongjuensis]
MYLSTYMYNCIWVFFPVFTIEFIRRERAALIAYLRRKDRILKLKRNIMSEEKMLKNQALIKLAYVAFNARNIDAILEVMHPEVKWPMAWGGGYANGHDEVRDYWEKQWKELDPHVTPVGFRERENGTLEVEVAQLVKDLAGNILFDGKVFHVYVINDGLLQRMEIEQ